MSSVIFLRKVREGDGGGGDGGGRRQDIAADGGVVVVGVGAGAARVVQQQIGGRLETFLERDALRIVEAALMNRQRGAQWWR